MPKTLYFDESGFTGDDLLNKEQSIFCVASSDIDEATADEILKLSFPRYQGPEIKFGNVWSRWANKKGLLKFAEEIAQYQENLFAYWIDKKFCTLTKFVDFLIEPVLHDAGYDFYANGYAPTFTNRVKFGLDNFCDPSLYESTLIHYDRFARSPTPENLSVLTSVLSIMAKSVPEEMRDYYRLASNGADRIAKVGLNAFPGSSNEVQLTTVLASVGYWRHKSDDDFTIIHDESSNFFDQSELWRAITGADVPQQRHSIREGQGFSFPLRVTSTLAGDSKEHRAIQLCDVLAGLVARAKRTDNSDEESRLLERVVDAGLGELMVDGIGPGSNFSMGPPQLLDGPDIVDQIAGIIHGSKDRDT